MKKLASIAVLLCAAVLSSCGEEAFPDITGPMAESRIKFFNFGVGAPGVYFYANNNKVAGISGVSIVIDAKTGVVTSSTESVTGTVYGGVTAGGYYSAVAPGTYTLSAKLADTTLRSTVVSTLSTNIAAGKHYSYYISGIYDATARTAEAFVVEDNFPANMDWTQAYVRFVNAVSNSNPMTLFATNTVDATETAIGAIQAYKGGGAFVAVPNGVYNLAAREAGATTARMSRTSVSFSGGRVYTISARGNILTTTTQLLDNTTNR